MRYNETYNIMLLILGMWYVVCLLFFSDYHKTLAFTCVWIFAEIVQFMPLIAREMPDALYYVVLSSRVAMLALIMLIVQVFLNQGNRKVKFLLIFVFVLKAIAMFILLSLV